MHCNELLAATPPQRERLKQIHPVPGRLCKLEDAVGDVKVSALFRMMSTVYSLRNELAQPEAIMLGTGVS